MDLMSEISHVRSKGAIRDIDTFSGDLKHSKFKSDRFLKHENSDFTVCFGVANPASFTMKINITKVILGL